MLFLVFKYN